MKIGRSKTIPTAFSLPVAERRRLLLTPDRLEEGGSVLLNPDEQHYLRRVLRLRCGEQVDVIDGCGRLTVATLVESQMLALHTAAQKIEPLSQPQLGLAVALMRRGMDEVIRMACELGIDRIQPLRCQRCVPQADNRPERWTSIIREAVEQCERLWMPQLHEVNGLSQWIGAEEGLRLVGVTRETAAPALDQCLRQQRDPIQPTWLLIGPEGGWTSAELSLFTEAGVQPVQMGSTILRSSTAAVAGAVELVRWRDGLVSS